MSSIYVSVPSISDDEFIKTLSRCLEKSSGLNKITIGAVGIFYYDEKKYIDDFIKFCKETDNIKFKIIDRSKNKGTGVARKEAFSFYNNEDYYLQIDSHSMFLANWDIILINNLEKAKEFTKLSRVVLSAYPPGYKYIKSNEIYCHDGWTTQSVSSFTTGSLLSITNHGLGCRGCEEWLPFPLWKEVRTYTDKRKYIPNPKISGAYLFADKEFAKDYIHLIKWNYGILEEELIMSIEAYNLGWKFYAINDIVPIAHLYAEDVNEFSGQRTCIVEDDILELEVKKNYINYCLDPKNFTKIKKFEKFANVDILNKVTSSKNTI